MTDQATESEFKPENWTYTGIGLGKGDAKLHGWLGPGGEDMWFSRLKGSVVGGIHAVEVKRDADGKFDSVRIHATWTGKRADDEAKLAEWHAANRLAQTQLEMKRALAKARQYDEFADVMRPLQELFRKARTSAQRSAFIAMVIDHLYRS
jgi:hypothetical protein